VTLRLLVCAAPLWLLGCASSPYPSVNDPMPPPDPGSVPQGGVKPATAAKSAASAVQNGTLKRADVERVVDAGLGRFLGLVAIEPSLSAGKFAGWSIVGLQPTELWGGIDLQPGDVVTKINGMAIEREVEAFEAFQAVRQAPALEISYLRQRQPRTLRFTIVGAPSPALPKAAPTADNAAVPAPQKR
jgi:S1-C subfamily serine protease